jgi:hypothetical protein
MHLSRFALPLLLLSGLLTSACEEQLSSPLIDFVSNGTTLTTDRVVTAPDTFEVRAFAESRSNDPELKRFTVTTQETYYADPNTPEKEDPERIYFDTVFTSSTKFFLFVNRFGASTSQGQQYWRYTVTDSKDNTASRRYRIIARPADSVNALHTYSVRLQAPRRRSSRASLATIRGFVLPPFATDRPDYSNLVDLVYVPTATGPSLASPSDTTAAKAPNLHVRSWPRPRRNTKLVRTTLTATAFAAVNSVQALNDIVAANTLVSNAAVNVAKGNVVAFQTAEGKSGLILVREVGTVAPVDLVLDVKVVRW